MALSISIFVILLALILLGIPVAMAIGLTGIFGVTLFGLGMDMATMTSKMFWGVNSYPLLAIPFFVFLGELMNKAGITRRVLDIADAIVGSFKGGLTYVNVLAAMIMASISGSGTACAAALGVSLIPDMEKRGYSKEYAIALTSCANVVGPIIPPSTLFILYAFYTENSIIKLFMGGVIPGIIIGLALMIVGRFVCKAKGFRQDKARFSLRKLGRACADGWMAVLIPGFLFISIIRGWATATEAGAIVCVAALIVGIIYRGITSFKDLIEVTMNAVRSSAIIYTLLIFSGIFSGVLVRARFTSNVANIISSITSSPAGTIFVIIIFIFILGMFVDVTPMVTMFALTFATVAEGVGFDPIHFGVLFIIICMIGAVTPPVGGILFVTCTIGKTSMSKITPMLLPFLVTLLIVTIAMIFFPPLVTWLPSLITGS